MNSESSPLSAPEAMVRIRMAMQTGDRNGARQIAETARLAHPDDAALADAAGDLALKTGDAETALAHFSAACTLAPTFLDFQINHAIALQNLGRHTEVIAALSAHEKTGRAVPRYGSVRATSHRALGQMAQAAQWYDTVLALAPRHPRALHGRARTAIERGEASAVQRFDAAMAVVQGDGDLWLGKAQALEVAGDIAGARTIAEQLCTQAPGFIAALSFLAGLKLAAGEADFTAPFRDAAIRAPQDPNIAATHVETLAGLDHAAQAADIAAAARDRFPSEPHFTLLEAVHAGSAGQLDRAERLFAQLDRAGPQLAVHEARHRIRTGEFGRAETLLAQALSAQPWDITAWSLRGIVWRLSDDQQARDRAHWLHEQDGLIQMRALAGRAGLVEDAAAELRVLHENSAMPLGQSLRGGTQTRGILFHRTEALLAELHEAILATLRDYREELPALDDTHPLLRHRDAPWNLAGSWSVRLTGGGDHHTAHIHPQGAISSALYLVVPQEASSSASGEAPQGWLEIGRPKADLGLDLPPIRSIRPVPGHLALFPSTAYHGTTPFKSAERMSVAFDVVT